MIESPVSYQVVQRNSNNVATITVTGYIGTGTHDIEARFNGANWQTISTNASIAFSGLLTNCAGGQGNLDVRWADNTNAVRTVSMIGVGDVFVIAGQSNASGQGVNNQSSSNGAMQASLFGNDYVWHKLVDPVDSAERQVDAISVDPTARGSVWPLVATHFMTNQAVPIAFVPCPLGGTSIGIWTASTNHVDRTTLYGSMAYRALTVGGAKAVLWWQGETDAQNAMSQSVYNTKMDLIADAVAADFGAKLMPCLLQNCTAIPDADEATINAAIIEAWGDNVNVIPGPDLRDISSDDSFHLISDAKIALAAERWWNALKTAFYP